MFRGPHVVSGGDRREARGILETKREIKDLRERIAAEHEALTRLAEETTGLEVTMTQASGVIAALHAEHHKHEKAIVAHDAQLQRATDDAARLVQKGDQLARERRMLWAISEVRRSIFTRSF